jgi:hypothetical protein
MNSNVVFQISTVVLALALATVLIVVYVIPEDEEEDYVMPVFNEGLIEVDGFDIVDESTGSSAKGKILAINDSEFRIRLIADIAVAEGDPYGFRMSVRENAVVDRLYCEFNGDIEESTNSNGYCRCEYYEYGTHMTEIHVDSLYYGTGKHKSGSGTLILDFKIDPKWRSDDLDVVQCFISIGDTYSGSYVRIFLPAKDPNKEVEGGSYSQEKETRSLRTSDPLDPIEIRFEDQDLVMNMYPVLSDNGDGTSTFTPNLVIPAGQGKFRGLNLRFIDKHVSATYTDFESMDPKAYSYESQYYLGKGAGIESDELEFTDSRTFAYPESEDKYGFSLRISLTMSQDGVLNTFSKTIGFHFSRSGIFYETVRCYLDSSEQTSPTYEQQIEFKKKVESGDVVCIYGDFTKIAEFTRMGVSYDPSASKVAVIYDRDKGEFHSHVFYRMSGDSLDVWAVSVLEDISRG